MVGQQAGRPRHAIAGRPQHSRHSIGQQAASHSRQAGIGQQAAYGRSCATLTGNILER